MPNVIGYNNVQLLGTVYNQPKYSDNGRSAFTRMILVTERQFKNRDGELQTYKDFHIVKAFGDQANICSAFNEGDVVFVAGRLNTEKYEKDGVTSYQTAVIPNLINRLSGDEVEDKQDDGDGLPF